MILAQNFYKECVENKVEISNWASDLYIPVNEITKKLVDDYEFKNNVTTFRALDDNRLMFEIPFGFMPLE